MRCILFFLLLCIIFSCDHKPQETPIYRPLADSVFWREKSDNVTAAKPAPKVLCALEIKLMDMGLVDVRSLDSMIRVDLRYSSTNNFFGADVYGNLEDAYLQPDVAEKLISAQELLHKSHSGYNLYIYDAARPMFVQQIMWDTVKIPIKEKTKYLSNPKKGSLHNYGAAVDITICDSLGKPLDMGTDFDYFGELAYPSKEQIMLRNGSLTNEQIANRILLRSVMSGAGFFNIQTEWWHFNSCNRYEAELKYKRIE